MTIRAVAWDVDGTLIDSEPIHLRALLDVCAAADVDLSDLSDEHFIGVALPDVWTALAPRFGASLTWHQWSDAIETAYLTEISRTSVPREAFAAVSRIAGFGLENVAVSNSSRRIVDANVAALGLGQLLAFCVTLDDVERPKPDPEPYRLAAERLGLTPGQMIAVEDSPAGCASAAAAGCPVIRIGVGAAGSGPPLLAMLADLSLVPEIVAGASASGSTIPPAMRRRPS
jgi:beta-phosphoglucomutase-like phosphatase (HAD superfamily)